MDALIASDGCYQKLLTKTRSAIAPSDPLPDTPGSVTPLKSVTSSTSIVTRCFCYFSRIIGCTGTIRAKVHHFTIEITDVYIMHTSRQGNNKKF